MRRGRWRGLVGEIVGNRFGSIRGLLLLVVWLLPGLPAGATEFSDHDSVLIVLPHDGRTPQEVPIFSVGEAAYCPLTSLARALAVPFSWDPYTYRGWIETDTTQTLFTLASPILTHAREGTQLERGIGYGESGVLIPLDYLGLLEQRWNGGRTVRWDRREATFDWGSRVQSIERVHTTQIGHRTTWRFASLVPPRATVLWSYLGGVDLLIDSLTIDPESLAIGSGRGLLAVRSVRERFGGCRIGFDAAAHVVGVRSGYDAEEKSWRLMATTSMEEVRRGGFEAVERIETSRPRRTGPVVLACWVDPVVDPSEGAEPLRALAEEVAEILSRRLGQAAVVIEGRNAIRMAARANRYDARAVVGLRVDFVAPEGDRIQIWTGIPRYRWQRLHATASDTVEVPRPPYWSETPALAGARSRRLAETVRAHLTSAVGSDAVVLGERPSRWLEGLLMPAILIYPVNAAAPGSIERLATVDRRSVMARAIAMAVIEGIGSDPSGSGER